MSTNSITEQTRGGIEPPLQTLQAHTLPLCYLVYPRRDLNPHAKGTGFWVQRVYHSATRVLDRNGLEPLTLCLSNIHSSQLSYRSAQGGTWTHINTVTCIILPVEILAPICPQQDLNLQPLAYKTTALPLSYRDWGQRDSNPYLLASKTMPYHLATPLLGARGFEPPRKIP